jgi:hypothetical protein
VEPEHDDEEDTYEVEAIIGRNLDKAQLMYEVKWQVDGSTTWEPASSIMQDVPEMVADYEEKRANEIKKRRDAKKRKDCQGLIHCLV